MNRDFRDLIAEFNAHNVEFLMIGAHALAAHGHVRATEDIDVWVRPEPENANTLYRTLSPKGNPELKSLKALQRAMGMQLTVRPLRKRVA